MTPFELAQRYIGIHEIAGSKNHPLIVWWLSLCGLKDQPDEVPWCSAFLNGIAWELRLPRSKSAAARSWLNVGQPILAENAIVGWDVVILQRGSGKQPGPEVTRGAPGHVGLFSGHGPRKPGDTAEILVLGGNQGDGVSIDGFSYAKILGVRRLRLE